jgi:tRNA uridine 5-carboxymethylaminomethyl modification enzyme
MILISLSRSFDFSFLANQQEIHSKKVIIATGTFLKGEIHIGLNSYPAGRFNEKPSIKLSESLTKAGLQLKRLRTGKIKHK